MFYSDVKFKKFNSQRRFGVELETGGEVKKSKVKTILKTISPNHESYITKYQLSGESSFWHIKDDATCGPQSFRGPKGVEISSFVGKGIKDIQHIAEIADGLSQAGCKVNDNCGLHIHAEAQDLTTADVGTILAYWLKMEEVLSMILPVHRVNNIYCQNISNKVKINRNSKWHAEDVWTMFKPTDLSFYDNPQRRVNINLVNYARAVFYQNTHRKTLELRWPEGTLSGHDIKCWVRLYLGFIDNCKSLPMPMNLNSVGLSETLTYLGLGHNKNDFLIFSEGLHDTRVWFLERIIKNAMTPFTLNRDFIFNGINYPKDQELRNNLTEEAKKMLTFINSSKRN